MNTKKLNFQTCLFEQSPLPTPTPPFLVCFWAIKETNYFLFHLPNNRGQTWMCKQWMAHPFDFASAQAEITPCGDEAFSPPFLAKDVLFYRNIRQAPLLE